MDAELKEICEGAFEIPTISFADLCIGHSYPVEKIAVIPTMYDLATLAQIVHESKTIKTFLPGRVTDALTEGGGVGKKRLDTLNQLARAGTLEILYLGTNNRKFKFVDCEKKRFYSCERRS